VAKGKGVDCEDGVPPGMVRGPNGQLWPAWVFCTRYSDRPSSGELERVTSFFILICSYIYLCRYLNTYLYNS
jgi:hypothetical protein